MNKPSGLSRRTFLWISFLFLAFSIFWLLFRRFNTAKQIVDFFGFDPDVERIIEQNLQTLQSRQKTGYRETVLFFAFDHYHLGPLIPKDLHDRVIGYWSKILLFRRSISWPYVHYPATDDLFLCNGLIRSKG